MSTLLLPLMLVGSGAFGGIVRASCTRGVEVLRKADFVGEILQGIPGAILAFVFIEDILLGIEDYSRQLGPAELVGVLAIGMVGGYGGVVLIEKTLEAVIAKVDGLERKQKELRDNLDDIQEQRSRDVQALQLAERQLSVAHQPDDAKAELKTSIRQASPNARFHLFLRAHDFRRSHWKNHPGHLERVIPILEGLLESEGMQPSHWLHAEMGYVLKDKRYPDFDAAVRRLTEAIEIRDAIGARLSGLYEFNRGIANIHRANDKSNGNGCGAGLMQAILDDLRTAKQYPEIETILKRDPKVKEFVHGWEEDHSLQLSS